MPNIFGDYGNMLYANPDDVLSEYLSGYQPHPWALKVTACHVIRRKLRHLSVEKSTLGCDISYMQTFAAHRETFLSLDWRNACCLYGMNRSRHAECSRQTFEIAGFLGVTMANTTQSAGVQVRHFSMYERCKGIRLGQSSEHDRLARMVVVEHLREFWEVVDVEVRSEHRRQGIATRLYNAVEQFNGKPFFAPSGWLTKDAHAFWSSRRPSVSRNFVEHPRCDGLLISVKQLLFVKKAIEFLVLQGTEPLQMRQA
jgi:GNAT superfamily N-acetyltransferase